MNILLQNLRNKTVLLYLSSGSYKEEYIYLPFDGIILCDKNQFKCSEIKDGKVLLLNLDNNALLRELIENDIKVDCVVGINDGCCEGGNYECINTYSFFSRLSPILKDECLYITDHFTKTKIMRKNFINVPFKSELIENPEFVSCCFRPSYSMNIKTWKLNRIQDRYKTKQLSQITCSVNQQSIWEMMDELDCIFISSTDCNYLKDTNYKIEYLSRYINRPFTNILSYANENHLNLIGITPYLDGRYDEVLYSIEKWALPYPRSVHFFHLHKDDMKVIYDCL